MVKQLENQYLEEKAIVKLAIKTIYQSALYEPGDGVMLQTFKRSYIIEDQNNKNHFVKMLNNQYLECKTCIGPPKASRCQTSVLQFYINASIRSLES